VLKLIDNDNCEWSHTVKVGNLGGYDCIKAPTVISPNSDGLNDTWRPIRDVDTGIEVSIFNRWGQLEYFYTGNTIAFEWDGLATDGNKLSSGDYYYIINFKNQWNTTPDRTGVISLIR
jgi:gliding motility-associated-like protein